MPETLKSILDTHPDLILRYDLDYVITYANSAISQFYGTNKTDIIGTSLLDRVSLEAGKAIQSANAKLTLQEPSYTKIQRIEHDTAPQYVTWLAIGVFDDGRLTGYQAIGRDITTEHTLERKLKSQTKELEQSRRELRSVIDNVPSMIWYKDDKNTILHLNESAADSMGMRVEDVEGQNTYDLFGDAAKSYHEADLKVINSGEAIRGLIEPYTPNDGEQGWVQTDKIPLDDLSGDPRILVVSTDVTKIKEQKAVLQSINKNLDDFASLVSHDLQAPLRRIALSAELMELELGDRLPDASKAYFADIDQGVTRMRELIRSFLSFMRASPQGVELAPTDLGSIIGDIIERERDGLVTADAQISLPDETIVVKGDVSLLRQVFTNLIENAVKYRHPDRPLTIDISAERNQLYWQIAVCDNGSGIDPAHQDKIFDLFGRAKPHVGIEGSGIGLALCRRIITLHGGTIELSETSESGSCFLINLYRERTS